MHCLVVSVAMLNVALSDILLNVVMLSVVAPYKLITIVNDNSK